MQVACTPRLARRGFVSHMVGSLPDPNHKQQSSPNPSDPVARAGDDGIAYRCLFAPPAQERWPPSRPAARPGRLGLGLGPGLGLGLGPSA